MNSIDKAYFDLLRHIQEKGNEKSDRTGTGTKSIFGYDIRFNMNEGFPLLTSKKMAWKSMVVELIWFLRGDTNIKYLVDNGCMIWVGDAYKHYTNYPIATIRDAIGNILYNNVSKGWCIRTGRGIVAPDPTRHLTREEFIEKIKTDDEFAKKWGELGPVYGAQWRNWGGYRTSHQKQYASGGSFGGPTHITYGEITEYDVPGVDQISNLIKDLKANPDSRRLIVNAWNVGELDKMTLPPCHYGFQCYTRELSVKERMEIYFKLHPDWAMIGTHTFFDGHKIPQRALSLKWTQRSVDTFLGLPFNIASYGLLLSLLAKEVNMIPEELIFSGGDVHIYQNHIEQCKTQLKQKTYKLPTIEIADKSIFDMDFTDIKLVNYESSPAIKGELSN